MKTLFYQLASGDKVLKEERAMIIKFAGKRRVLSTAYFNGGYREDLEAVFNYCECHGAQNGDDVAMRAPTAEKHMRLIASELNLAPEKTTGLSTAVEMKNVSVQSKSYHDFTVTCLATAGVEGNGGRAGDPACWHEHEGKPMKMDPGTINIILALDADLTPGAMARILVTCTEAKTAALQELLAPSKYSRGLATGSGTDGVVVIANQEAKLCFAYAGKHGKLGEYCAYVVKKAVKEALYLHSGFSAQTQHSVLKRMARFGLDENLLWELCRTTSREEGQEKTAFLKALKTLDGQERLVSWVSLYAHLLDQLDWGLLSAEETLSLSDSLLAQLACSLKVSFKPQRVAVTGREQVLETMVDNLALLLAARLKNACKSF